MFRPTTPGQASRARRRFRPQLEMLEDRSVPAAIDLPSGAVSWWSGDGHTVDLLGANPGTLQNGASFVPGKVAQAFSFDGTDDYVNVPDSPSLTLGGAFTIELWVNFDVVRDRNPFIGHDEGGGELNKWIFWYDASGHDVEPGVPALRFHINSPPSAGFAHDAIVAPWDPVTGRWYHVAVTRDGNSYALYIDGAQVATSVDTMAIPDPAFPLTIGRAEGNFHDGQIDEPTIYGRALSAAEIQSIYAAGSDGKIMTSYVAADFISVLEGSGGSNSVATFTLTRLGSLAGQATVNWTTADGTAVAGSDYIAASGQVVFLDGESQKTVAVNLVADNTYESDETFMLLLSTSTPDVGAGLGRATILNDDPVIFVDDTKVVEGAQASVTVRLSLPSSTPVSVNYATAPGTATAAEFTHVSGTLTFSPGETAKSIAVQTSDDSIGEPTKTFTLNLSGAVGADIIDGQAVIKILDNETKFYVVNDGAPDKTFEYGSEGAPVETYNLNAGNTAPRGAASNAAGTKVWVVDANKKVYVYNPSGQLLGSWTANGLGGSADIQGIATNGVDVWIVARLPGGTGFDAKVYKYANAASRLSGSQNAKSSFSVGQYGFASDIVTDGTHLWLLSNTLSSSNLSIGDSNASITKLTLSGSLVGRWGPSFQALGGSYGGTGITLDPANPRHIWVLSKQANQVWQFDDAVSRTSGSQAPSAIFDLGPGNTNAQGIADPPVPTSFIAPASVPDDDKAADVSTVFDDGFEAWGGFADFPRPLEKALTARVDNPPQRTTGLLAVPDELADVVGCEETDAIVSAVLRGSKDDSATESLDAVFASLELEDVMYQTRKM